MSKTLNEEKISYRGGFFEEKEAIGVEKNASNSDRN